MSVGLVIVTHGASAGAMLATVTRMLGPGQTDNIQAVEIEVQDARARVFERIRAATETVDHGAGVVIVCDLHGSTPTNCAVEVMSMHPNVTVVCGVNLPMVVKLCTAPRDGVTPDEVAHAAIETAVRSIRVERGRDRS